MRLLIPGLILLAATGWCGAANAGPIQAADIVSVDGVEWAQADLFTGLSWDDITAVCPTGVCANQNLNGNDMAGWLWATVDDMNQLFNHYIGFDALGPGPDRQTFPDDFTASTAFYGDGWRVTGDFFGEFTMGRVSDDNNVAPALAIVRNEPFFFTNGDNIGTDGSLYNVTGVSGNTGAWFYRGAVDVPVPASLWLFGSALLGLGMTKRKQA